MTLKQSPDCSRQCQAQRPQTTQVTTQIRTTTIFRFSAIYPSKASVLALTAALLVISGCTSIKRQPTEPWQQQRAELEQPLQSINDWRIKGRIGVRTPEDAFSANLIWDHAPSATRFKVFSSLGQTYVDMESDAEGAVLRLSDERTLTGRSPDQLIAQALGWELPLEHLTHWVRGLPGPLKIMPENLDDKGRLSQFSYNGWQVEYREYREVGGRELPRQIILENEQVWLKLILRSWQTNGNYQQAAD